MKEPLKLSVKSLTRVEGEGGLRIRVAEDGRLDFAEFNIYEPPRFFERLLRGREVREVPDIVARICGICPVAYQLTACGALENALGIRVTRDIRRLRQLLYCGEWIQSHALHVFLLHAADYLGFESGFTLAAARPEFVERGLRMKAIGSRILEVIGGRAVHPINVAVGGFHRSPDAAAIRLLVPELEWGLAAALETAAEVATFDAFAFDPPCDLVALDCPFGYVNAGDGDDTRIRVREAQATGSAGLDIPIADYERHFRERQVPHSTALHSLREPAGTPYLVGPIPRLTLCRERLPPRTRRAADACGLEHPCTNSFRSIVVRMLEVAAAFEEALAIAAACRADLAACRIEAALAPGSGCHATEAPRGLLYQRFEIGADGLVAAATIIPPTSQNQARIEADLRELVPRVLPLGVAEATRRCEQLVRNYDPCISCATHAVQIVLDGQP